MGLQSPAHFPLDFSIALRYTLTIAPRYIAGRAWKGGGSVDAHIRKVYVPMTETAFYILLCLQTPNHGYGVVQREEDKRKIYESTQTGREVLQLELKRIERLYRNAKEALS